MRKDLWPQSETDPKFKSISAAYQGYDLRDLLSLSLCGAQFSGLHNGTVISSSRAW